MTVEQLIRQIKAQWSEARPPSHLDPDLPSVVTRCRFAHSGVEVEDLNAILRHRIPDELREFWRVAEWAKLFEDPEYGQWGLHVLTPHEALRETLKYCKDRAKDFVEGDFIVGRFLGDSDLLLIRCQQSVPDFGQVLVVLPLDPRGD